MSANPKLFPAIGSVADQTEKLRVEAQTVAVTLDEERPVQEIESLCMRCEEQVCRHTLNGGDQGSDFPSGCYKASFDIYPLLPGGHCYVLLL